MKKFGILLLALVLLLGCTSCFTNYKEVKTDAVESVGDVPTFIEEEFILNGASYGAQIGNVFLCDTSEYQKDLTLTAYDIASETTKELRYDYSTETYYLDGIYPAKDGNFFLLLTANYYEENQPMPLIVKSDLNGTVIWETKLQNPDFNTFTDLEETESGDIYVIGYTSVEITDSETVQPVFFGGHDDTELEGGWYDDDAYAAKLDAQGNLIGETVIGDTIDTNQLTDAFYLEGVGLLTVFATYDAESTLGNWVMCLDENCREVWKTEIATDEYDSTPYLVCYDGQIYCYYQNTFACRVNALDTAGSLVWEKTFEDDSGVFLLESTLYNQPVISRTDACFTLDAKDGSVEQYLWEDEVGTIYGIYPFQDYYIIESDHVCGGYYDGIIRMGDIYESVYSAYDYEGNLLWRKGFTY